MIQNTMLQSTVISVLTLLILLCASCAPSPLQSDHKATLQDLERQTAPATNTIKIMTFNLRYANNHDGENAWDKRKDLVVQTIRDTNPDLLGTQECLKVQADYLKEHLPDYAFVGVGRDDGKDKGEMSALFIRKSKFDVLNSGHFWLSTTPDKPGSVGWDAALTRMASWADLRLKDTDKTPATEILYCNTHFDHKGVRARENSAALLRSMVESFRTTPDEPIIITGDFNSPANPRGNAPHIEQTYHNLIDGPAPDSQHWQDCYLAVHPIPEDAPRPLDQGTFQNFTGHPTSNARIDWIITTPGFKVLDAQIIKIHSADGHYPSDHFSVSATVVLPSN